MSQHVGQNKVALQSVHVNELDILTLAEMMSDITLNLDGQLLFLANNNNN